MTPDHAVSLTPEALLSHADFVRRLARGLLGDAHAADDVTQDTLAAAVTQSPRVGAPRGWLAAVALNFARQWRRGERRRRARELTVAAADVAPSPDEVLAREALRASVVRAVLALPEPSRGAVLMRFWDDLPPRRIAAALGVPVETVRTRIKRGLERLREQLDASPEIAARRDLGAALLLLAGPPPATATAASGAWLLAVATRWTAAAALLLGAGLVWWLWRAPPLPPIDPTPDVVVAGNRAPVTEPAQRQPVPARALVIAGRVVGPDRAPVAGAGVWIAAERAASVASRPALLPRGRGATTDQDGAFRVDLGAAPRAWVEVVTTGNPMLLPPASGGHWHETSVTDLELVLDATPTGMVEVTVTLAGGNPLSGFEAQFWRQTDGRVLADRTATERLVMTLPLTRAQGDEFEITVAGPTHSGARTRVLVQPGSRQEVRLTVGPRTVVEGIVADANGTPLPDALVFFGTVLRLRGDEPFKPFVPGRVRDGVRTDAQGRFTLDGVGDWITAFHDRATPLTVARADAGRITLPALGAIAGRLVDQAGRGRASVAIALDRERPVTTDADGAFAFADVRAGVRGLCLPGKQYVGVTVRPGETARVVLGAGLEAVTIRLTSEHGPVPALKDAVLIGLGEVAPVLPCEIKDATITLRGAPAGRYVLYTREARDRPEGGRIGVATVELASAEAEAALGSATLRVIGTPGRRVFVVPEGQSEMFDVLAARICGRSIAADGTVTFNALPPGRFVVVEEPVGSRGGQRVPVTIVAPATEVRLP